LFMRTCVYVCARVHVHACEYVSVRMRCVFYVHCEFVCVYDVCVCVCVFQCVWV